MSREIPEPLRAAAGLAATVLDEVKKLPGTIPGLPVRAVGLAMQAALKLQQEYAGLVARGDELFTGIRGEREPGLATFDEDDEPGQPAPAPPVAGFRDSAFDRAEAPPPDADATAPATVDLDEIAEADSALEELAIEELVDTGPGTAGPGVEAEPVDAGADAVAIENALLEADAAVATEEAGAADITEGSTAEPVAALSGDDTPPPADDTSAADAATATDESGTPIAAATGVRTDVGDADTSDVDAAGAEGAAVDAVGGVSAEPTDDPTGGSEVSGSQAAGTAPVDGYDGFSIAQLRGRLRGYAPSTVESLLAYEEATRGRDPYVRMLRNRLERLTADEVAASPLAPRGA